jgi:ribosomal protein S18 acetylase RimI-like enzyme
LIVNIRPATNGDFDFLLSMNSDLYPDDYCDVRQFKKAYDHGVHWVAEDSGKIVAALISEVEKGTPYIWSVATYPTHRGKGLATLMIQEFEKHYAALGYEKSWLHVRVENPAQKLYFDLGYRVASFEPNIYGPHSHGLIMRKKIG